MRFITKFGVFFWLNSLKKYIDFHHKSEIWRIISKKYADFGCKSGKLAVQIEEEHCKNANNTEIWKISANFQTAWWKLHQVLSLILSVFIAFFVQILIKIRVNFLVLSIVCVFTIFFFNLNCEVARFMTKFGVFFQLDSAQIYVMSL